MKNYVKKLDYVGEIDKFKETYNLPRMMKKLKL